LIPTINAYAVPGGRVTKAAVDLIEGELLSRIASEKPDAVVLSLHGAMVTDESDDGEGMTISRVRQIIGPDVPLIVDGDPRVPWSDVLNIVNLGRRLGLAHVQFASSGN
jgi:microcystin degradation protein MlrC